MANNHQVALSGNNAPALPPAQQQMATMQSHNAPTAAAHTDMMREVAKVQAAVMLAKQFPRNLAVAVDKIKTACGDVVVADDALYQYNRGGTDVTGPTVGLMTMIATYLGNIKFGFDITNQRVPAIPTLENPGETEIRAWAWDVENNTERSTTFTVRHVRNTKRGSSVITDERDVYEMCANLASRRMRRALEDLVPAYIVDAAVEACQETMKSNVDVTPETIKKLIDSFQKFGVSKQQLEKRIGRNIDALTPGLYVKLRSIWKSLNDGMSEVTDWFEVITMDAKPEAEAKPVAEKKEAKPATEKASESAETTDESTSQPATQGNAMFTE